jgi:hypothetical protein
MAGQFLYRGGLHAFYFSESCLVKLYRKSFFRLNLGQVKRLSRYLKEWYRLLLGDWTIGRNLPRSARLHLRLEVLVGPQKLYQGDHLF